MLGIVIFFTALLAILPPSKGDTAIEEILKELQTNALTAESTDTSSSTSDDTSRGISEHLKKLDLKSLIQLASHLNNQNQNKNQRHQHQHHPYSMHRYHHTQGYNSNKFDKSNYELKHLDQLLKEDKKITSHKRLVPNKLLNPTEPRVDFGLKKISGLNEYSKIFVVLDPAVLQNNLGNTDGLSSLLSKILFKTSAAAEKTRQERKEPDLYKGFKINKVLSSRRYRRDSKEMYGGGGGSMEDDYRPKRPRNDYGGGGGGGGGGGRTAIPYIRHRGDIYEKDH